MKHRTTLKNYGRTKRAGSFGKDSFYLDPPEILNLARENIALLRLQEPKK